MLPAVLTCGELPVGAQDLAAAARVCIMPVSTRAVQPDP